MVLDRLRQDIGETELRAASSGAPPLARRKLLAVADAYAGLKPIRIGLDHEVPEGTIIRWLSIFSRSGIHGLVFDRNPVHLLAGTDPEIAASAAFAAPPGIEKTALRAVAAACRGSSIPELASHYMTDDAEIGEWIGLFAGGGASALTSTYRRVGWLRLEPGQAFFARRGLPSGYNDLFLRDLHSRLDGEFARRIMAIALAYEGRNVRQVSAALGVGGGTLQKWVNDFIANGVPGIAPRTAFARVPRREGYGASAVAALAAQTDNAEFRKRLNVIAMAYRSESLIEIGRQHKMANDAVHRLIIQFERGGPEGLAYGEGTLTPPLRDDYSVERLMQIAAEITDDDPGRLKVEAVAQLYDGVSMATAARGVGGLPAIRIIVDRFNRFGHEILESFRSWEQAPKPPALREVPAPDKAIEMRSDFNLKTLQYLRWRVTAKTRMRLEMIIDAYSGIGPQAIADSLGIKRSAVMRSLNLFNRQGLEWLLSSESSPSPPKLPRKKRERRKVPKRHSPVPLRSDWNTASVRSAMYRSIDPKHRKELDLVLQLYMNNGSVGAISERNRTPVSEIERVATAFELHGESLGRSGREEWMLPHDYDLEGLREAKREPEPLRTYAQIVSGLYSGRNPRSVIATFDLRKGELEKIVQAFRNGGVAALENDPLNVRATMPAPVTSPPPDIAASMQAAMKPHAPPIRKPYPPRPVAQEPAAVKDALKVEACVREGVPRRASLVERLASYAKASRRPYDDGLSAVALSGEGNTIYTIAGRLAMRPEEVESWLNLYKRRGAKAFIPTDKLIFRPTRTDQKGSDLRKRTNNLDDDLYERRLLVVADSLDEDDMVSICERHEVTYEEAAECIAAYSVSGIQGLGTDYAPVRIGADMLVEAAMNARKKASHPKAPVFEPPRTPIRGEERRSKIIPREYRPPATAPARAGNKATAMFEGRNAHRLDAVREFHRNRNLHAVAKQFNVSPGTLENWLVAYVKTGMAERDRAAAR